MFISSCLRLSEDPDFVVGGTPPRNLVVYERESRMILVVSSCFRLSLFAGRCASRDELELVVVFDLVDVVADCWEVSSTLKFLASAKD